MLEVKNAAMEEMMEGVANKDPEARAGSIGSFAFSAECNVMFRLAVLLYSLLSNREPSLLIYQKISSYI